MIAKTPDTALTSSGFAFQAEAGQHLARANRLLRGQLQGRDFFNSAGPLFDLAVAGSWIVFGRTLASTYFYDSLAYALGYFALLLLAASFLRLPALVLLLPFFNHLNNHVPIQIPQLRIGLALLGVACLVAWLRGGRRSWCLAAGVLGGLATLYSQEYGFVFLLVAAVGFALRGEARAAGLFLLGVAATVAPLFIFYTSHHALGALMRDLLEYPLYAVAGFAKRPFPSLFQSLPWRLGDFGSPAMLAVRAGYAVPAIALGALLLVFPADRLPLRPMGGLPARVREATRARPDAIALFLAALFGLLLFRSALGRSDLAHLLCVMPVPALLLVVGIDRALDMARAAPLRPLAVWRIAALALLAWLGAFFATSAPIAVARENFTSFARVLGGYRPLGDPVANEVTDWVRSHSAPDDPILFLPTNAAYYYLTDRRNPTRFDLGYQMVTDAHRAEALSDLKAAPPRWVVRDEGAWRVDGIPDTLVLGGAMIDWLDANYAEVARIGSVSIAGRKRVAGGER